MVGTALSVWVGPDVPSVCVTVGVVPTVGIVLGAVDGSAVYDEGEGSVVCTVLGAIVERTVGLCVVGTAVDCSLGSEVGRPAGNVEG